jgi:hypothetical protein
VCKKLQTPFRGRTGLLAGGLEGRLFQTGLLI